MIELFKQRVILSWVTLMLVVGVHANVQAQDEYSWTYINNGVQVNDIAGTNGDIWVATNGGAAHIDGSGAITRYNAGNTPMGSNFVTSIEVDNEGDVWVGTNESGVYRYDGANWLPITTSNSLIPSDQVSDIEVHADTVYVGLLESNGTIAKLVGGNISIISVKETGFSDIEGVHSIQFDENGDLWVGTDGEGVVKLSGGEFTTYDEGNSGIPGHNAITDLEFDTEGNLWLTTDLGDIVTFDGSAWTEYDTFNSDLPDDAYDLEFDSNGLLWIATESGLASYDGSSFATELPADAEIGTNLVSLLIDDIGTFWTGSLNNEIASYDGSTWQRYGVSASGVPKGAEIREIDHDSQGNMWVTIDYVDGIVRYDGSEWTLFNGSNSPLSRDDIHVVEEGPDGNIWAGSGFFLYMYDGTEWTIDSSIEGDIRDMDSNSNLGVTWAATQNGLFKLENGAWTQFDGTDDPILDEELLAVHVMDNGDVWASYGDFGSNGLIHYDGTDWTVYDADDYNLVDFEILDIESDASGNLWMGNYYGGLVYFDGEEFKSYNRENSALTSGRVNSVEIDKNGNLWMSFANYQGSVAKFDRSKFTVFTPDNSALTNHFVETISVDANGDKWIGNEEGEIMKLEGGMNPSAQFNASLRRGVAPVTVDFSHPGNPNYYTFNWTFEGGTPSTSSEANPQVEYSTPGTYSVTLEVTNSYGTDTHTKSGYIEAIDEVSPEDNYWVNYTNGSVVLDIEEYGDEIWVATNGGITIHNRVENSYRYLNASNSALPGNRVSDIAVNSSGTVWAATNGGLLEIDGEQSVLYTSENSNLPADEVTSLFLDSNETLWLGTAETSFGTKENQGLISFDGSEFSVEASSLSSGGAISSIDEAANGDLWIGVNGGGIAIFDGSEITDTYTSSNSSLEDDRVNVVAIDPDENVWVGTQFGLYRYDGSAWNEILFEAFFSSTSIATKDIAFNNEGSGTVWVGSSAFGLIQIQESGVTIFNNDNPNIGTNNIETVFVDSQYTLWTGTIPNWLTDNEAGASALKEFDGFIWKGHPTSANPLPSNLINHIEADQKGGVWLNASTSFNLVTGESTTGAIIYARGNQWDLYNSSNSPLLDDESVNDLFVDSEDKVWVAYDSFILWFDGTHWVKRSRQDLDAISSNVVGFTETPDGNIWVALSNTGLYEYDGETWTLHEPSEITLQDTEEIVATSDGTIWISTFGNGIHTFDGSAWATFNASNSALPADVVDDIGLDAQGRVNALITEGSFSTETSLFYYESDAWTEGELPDNISDPGGFHFTEDGTFWVFYESTSSTGFGLPTVAYKQDDTFEILDAENSVLTESKFEALTVDAQGKVWIGTNDAGAFVHDIDVVPTDVEKMETPELPGSISLKQNYPNPFNPSTTIEFTLDARSEVTLTVYDILGRKVQTLLANRPMTAGAYQVQFNASSLASGTYLYRLEAGGEVRTQKMTLIK